MVELLISLDGLTVRALYSDDFDFRDLGAELGELSIARASHVEPTLDGRWTADMGPVSGPVLGPFDTRAEALAEEVAWLKENRL